MTKRWAFACGIVAMFVSGPAWADRDTAYYSSVTVFGDSLVDAGNYYLATGGVNPAPGLPYPDPAQGYFPYRLTNGFDYPDLLSRDLFNNNPTNPSALGGSNFAFAAARILDTGDPVPDMQFQIDMWKASGQAIDKDGLYILNFGANDVFGALGVFGPGNTIGTYPDVPTYIQTAVDTYVNGVKQLQALGVRNILMTDFPLANNALSDDANLALKAALVGLTLNADTDLFFYSISDFNKQILADPTAYGVDPALLGTSCIQGNAQASGCQGYFTFDGVHPTAALQAAAYNDMNQKFGLTAAAVPEPTVWTMMILGFGMIGGAMRRKRRAALPA